MSILDLYKPSMQEDNKPLVLVKRQDLFLSSMLR